MYGLKTNIGHGSFKNRGYGFKAGWLALLFFWASFCAAATLHVTPGGKDSNPGTEQAPLASVNKAYELFNKAGGPGEIVIHEGRYDDLIFIGNPKTTNDVEVLPALLIRAADGAKVVFDDSTRVTKTETPEGRPGVFLVKGNYCVSRLDVWEDDTRIRYKKAADVDSASRFPGSFYLIDEKTLAISTSDGAPPGTHVVRVSSRVTRLAGIGCFIDRENTTLRGITFDGWAHTGIVVHKGGSNVVIEDCSVFRCYRAISTDGNNTRCLRCVGRDVGSGFYSGGSNAVVEHCRFFAARDGLAYEQTTQDDTGIYFYHPGNSGTIRFNLCEGFLNGIFLKGVEGTFRIEHNTLVGGFYLSKYEPGTVVRQNIITGGIQDLNLLEKGGVFDENLFWYPKEPQRMWKALVEARKWGAGWLNRIGDPRFVAPERGDFRLLQGKATIAMGDAEGPVGAFPLAPEGYVDSARPELCVYPYEPAQYNGPCGKLYFIPDPWLGGETSFIEDLATTLPRNAYITKQREVRLHIQSSPPGAPVSRMKVSVDGEEGKELPFRTFRDLVLPDKDGEHAVVVQVGTDKNVWSDPVRLELTLVRNTPALVGTPTVRAGKHGAVVRFKADRPALCSIEVETGSNQWREVANTSQDRRDYDPGLGVTKWENWQIPKTNHVLALTGGIVNWIQAGKENRYRIKVKDFAGNESSFVHTVKCEGEPRAFYVAANGGVDAEDRGAQNAPLATVQYALDRTLPGDTVRLLPGIHKGGVFLYHGGVSGFPITIEAEKPGTAILDGMKREPVLLYLENAPWVVIRNLEFRWFGQTGIYVYKSPSCVVSGCHIWNSGVGGGYPQGNGLFFMSSPKPTVDHVTIHSVCVGIVLWYAPGARITYNTSAVNLFGGLSIIHSTKDTVVRNNVLCFNGISQMNFEDDANNMRDGKVFASFDADYNNYACRVTDVVMGPLVENENLKNKSYGNSKSIIGCLYVKEATAINPTNYPFNGRFYTMESWKKSSWKDAHSIYADPLWVDPQKRRFDLQGASPNIGAGENGSTIGAAGWLDKEKK